MGTADRFSRMIYWYCSSRFLLASLVFCTMLPVAGMPATLTVTDAGDTGAGTLRDAITTANGNGEVDTIDFSVAGPILLNSQIIITDPDGLTINGGSTITIQAGTDSRIFEIQANADVTLDGLTLTGGDLLSFVGGDGGAILNAGTLLLTNSELDSNFADNGGGIYNSGNLTVNSSNIMSNEGSFDHGGGIYNTGTLTIQGSTFSNNTTGGSGDGGGIYNNSAIAATITKTTFSNNGAVAGGGIHNFLGDLTVIDSTFTANEATGFNGGGGIFNEATLKIVNSTFNGNLASSGEGGGMLNAAGTSVISNSTFSGNQASPGGAIAVTFGTANLDNSLFANSTGFPPISDCADLGGTINARHSLLESGTACVDGTDTANLTGDPALGAFVPGNPGYFPLTPSSPAIDAGLNSLIPSGIATDQPGNARVQNLIVDMGAVESGSLGCPASRVIPDNRWTQVGVPCDDGTLTVGSVFADDMPGTLNTNWSVWHFDTATQQNTQLNNLGDTVQIGKGYWIKQISGGPITIDATGAATPPANYPLAGIAGGQLNLIANYRADPGSICWASVEILDTSTSTTYPLAQASNPAGPCSVGGEPCVYGTAYRWNGNAYDPLTGTTPGLSDGALAVMDSVWLQAYKPGLRLIIPATGPCPATRTRPAAREWYQRLRVEGPDDMLDETNVLGQLHDSVDGLDSHDIADLSPFGSPYLTLSFQHPTEEGDFNSDYRAVGADDEHRWAFEIRSDTPREVTLSWEDPYGKLAGATLVDLESNTEISPAPGGEYPVSMVGTVHRFEWRVSVEGGDPDMIFQSDFD